MWTLTKVERAPEGSPEMMHPVSSTNRGEEKGFRLSTVSLLSVKAVLLHPAGSSTRCFFSCSRSPKKILVQ